MKQIQTIKKGTNFTAANIGHLADLKDYVLELGPEIKSPEKYSAAMLWALQEVNSHFRFLLPGRKQVSSTPTKTMKNFTYSSPAKASFRLTAMFFPLRKAL